MDEAFKTLDMSAIKDYLSAGVSSISWNHAKLVAVNGTTAMTGGGNFWGQYANNNHDIIDMQAKVLGDAAVSAHAYCNYFWEYLNALAGINAKTEDNMKTADKVDTISFMSTTKLSGERPTWTVPTEAVPLFPIPWKKGGAPPKSDHAKFPVLTVAKLGDWTGNMTTQVRFPVQFVDAVRDILRNVVWSVVFSPKVKENQRASFYQLIATRLSDTGMRAPDWSGLARYDVNISPAAWASPFARCYAIANAKKRVYICSELFATFLAAQDETQQQSAPSKDAKDTKDPKEAYKKMLNSINATLGNMKAPQWNGRIWPFGMSHLSSYVPPMTITSISPQTTDTFIHRPLRCYCRLPSEHLQDQR